MTFRRAFKEVYIRLAEDEEAFVCSVEYGGLLRRAMEFPLVTEPEALPDLKDESPLVLRTRRRSASGNQPAAQNVRLFGSDR